MKFSVIIPVHNAEKYIREAVDSVIAQEIPSDVELEVLLIENGSEDGSADICDDYSANSIYENIRIKSTHMGKASAYEARQEGARLSSGEWIVFMDADDKVVPGLIKNLHEEISKHVLEDSSSDKEYEDSGHKNVDGREAVDVILYNAAELQTPDNKMFKFPFKEGVVYGTEDRADFHRLMCSGDSLNAMWNKCIKRELARETCLSDGKRLNHGEDLLQTAAIIDRAKGIAYLDRILYLYRINEEGLTGSYHEEFLDNQAKAWEAFDEYAHKWCGDKYDEIIRQRKTLTCTIGMKKLIYSSLPVGDIKVKLKDMMTTDFYEKYALQELPDWAPEEDVFVHGLQVMDDAEKKLMNSCRKHKFKSYIKARIRKNGI